MSAVFSKPVVHLELHTGNLPRALAFYTKLLGWRPERIQAGDASYTALELGEEDSSLGGGIVECQSGRSLWLPYVEVDEVSASTERALDLGAKVLLKPREGPAGWRSVVASPAGAEIAFWQAKEKRR